MTVMGTIGRLILVPFAFILALAAAAAVLVSLGLERMTQALAEQNIDATNVSEVMAFVRDSAAIVSALSLVPAILIVVIGEVARIRSVLFYTIGGGLALASAPIVARAFETGALNAPAGLVWQVMATAGFCGGFVYWLLAGRTA